MYLRVDIEWYIVYLIKKGRHWVVLQAVEEMGTSEMILIGILCTRSRQGRY